MVQASQDEQGRVLLAADAGSYSVASVNLAVAMASSAGGLLQGLFVEDEDLLQVTGLPCSSEITLTTATERRTSSEQMQRSLRLVARQFRQTLQQQAQALQVSWSFDTTRGRVRDIGLRPAIDATYTILACPLTLRLPSTQVRAERKILLLGKSSPRQQQALDMLIGRYTRERIELTLGAGDSRDSDWLDTARWAQLHDHRITLTGVSVDELLARLGQSGSIYDCAILSAGRKDEDTAMLLKALRCPVILIA
jgi:hypothetical protein